MKRFTLSKRRIAALVLGLGAAGAVAAFTVEGASAEGRTLDGAFCAIANNHTCMTLSFDGVAHGTPNRDDFALRPGTYWLSVFDNSGQHDFVLRSCPGTDSPCTAGNGTTQQITTIGENDSGTGLHVTVKLNLEHGTYRLYCDAPFHEAGGMYVDFAVGGAGQVG